MVVFVTISSLFFFFLFKFRTLHSPLLSPPNAHTIRHSSCFKKRQKRRKHYLLPPSWAMSHCFFLCFMTHCTLFLLEAYTAIIFKNLLLWENWGIYLHSFFSLIFMAHWRLDFICHSLPDGSTHSRKQSFLMRRCLSYFFSFDIDHFTKQNKSQSVHFTLGK